MTRKFLSFRHLFIILSFWARSNTIQRIRLSSKEYCMRISPLFGCETIDELKAVIKKAHFSSDFTYPRAFRCAPGITASIEIDDIGKYN